MKNLGISLVMFMVPSVIYALGPDKVAHFGVSFVANTVAYAGCRAIFKKDEHKAPCLVASIIGTTAMGIAKEVTDGNKNSAEEHGKDLLADSLGIAASSITIKIAF